MTARVLEERSEAETGASHCWKDYLGLVFCLAVDWTGTFGFLVGHRGVAGWIGERMQMFHYSAHSGRLFGWITSGEPAFFEDDEERGAVDLLVKHMNEVDGPGWTTASPTTSANGSAIWKVTP